MDSGSEGLVSISSCLIPVSQEQEAGNHNNHCICDAESKNISTSGHSLHSTATVIITSYHVLDGTCTGNVADSY
jgi:hypothetical protein